MGRISVLIPIFRESEFLPEMLRNLTRQDAEKEIIVVVDEPTEKTLQIKREFEEKVKFIINNERIGKSRALNNAAKQASGEILLFLDADIKIPRDSKFLERIISSMRHADILDIKKRVIKNSFLSKMTYYEYAGFNIGSWLLSKFMSRCPGINGSAFAIRKEVFCRLGGFRNVVAEDLDIAMRSFVRRYIFMYAKDVEVQNYVPSTWGSWIKQRKRWGIGLALWLKEWYKTLLWEGIRSPQLFIPTLFFLFPSLIVIALNIFIPDALLYKVFIFILSFLTIKFNFVMAILLFGVIGWVLFKSLTIMIASFLIYSLVFYLLSRKIGYRFNLIEFILYYFLYSNLCLLTTFQGFILVLFNKITVNDWKV